MSQGEQAWDSAGGDVTKCVFGGGFGGYLIGEEMWEWSRVDACGAVWRCAVVQGRVTAWVGRWHGGRWEENIPGGRVKLIGSGASSEAKLTGIDDRLYKGGWGKEGL